MNDPNLNAYLQQGSQIGIFNPDYVNQGLIGSVKVKDKRGNEYNKLVINPNHPFASSLSGAVEKYTKNVYKEEKNISADSEYGRKRQEELEYPDFSGWSQGLEGKPIASGASVKETELSLKNHEQRLKDLSTAFRVSFDDDLNNIDTYKNMSDADLAAEGLSRELINKFLDERNAILESKNIAQTKANEAEEYAKSKLGSNYTKLKAKYDALPEIGGYSKEELIYALKSGGKDAEGKIKLYDPVLAALFQAPKEVQEKYSSFVKDKTNDKLLRTKEEYYKQNGKKQSTYNIEYGWNIGGYNKEQLRTMRAAAENYFTDVATWAHHIPLSNDSEINGKPFAQYLQEQGVDINDPKQFSVDPKGVALSKNVLNPSVESQNKLAFRVTVKVKGLVKELWITTDQVSSPEIKKIVNSPQATAYNQYSAVRREGVNNYSPLRYADYDVKYNYQDKYRPIEIDGIKYDEETGLRKLAGLETAKQMNLSKKDALKAIKDI